jgi:D-alanyl-D-alanine carboxypeptidase
MRTETVIHRLAPLLAWGSLLLSAACSPAARIATPEPDPIAHSIDLLARAAVDDGTLVGLSVAVLRGDRIIFDRGYGSADLEHSVPGTPDTRYYVGSITKPFTAAAILRLADQGLLDLDHEVSRYLPELDSSDAPISLRHLLNHTSGMAGPQQVAQKFLNRRHLEFTREELIQLVRGEPRVSRPGEQMAYNNLGYVLLGIVVERVSGRTYEDFLTDQLLGGDGRSIALCDSRRVIPDRARGYEIRDGAVFNHEPVNASLLFAAGGICATARDVAIGLRSLLGGEVLSSGALQQMTSRGRLENGSELTYGYGIFVEQLEGQRRLHHGGVANGFAGHAAHYPDEDLTVVVLSNTRSMEAQRLEAEITRRLLGRSPAN